MQVVSTLLLIYVDQRRLGHSYNKNKLYNIAGF